MSPSTRSRRRPRSDLSPTQPPPKDVHVVDLFVDPMLGGPLAIYIDHDVLDRPKLVDLVKVSWNSCRTRFSYTVQSLMVVPYGVTDAWRQRIQWIQFSAIHLRYEHRRISRIYSHFACTAVDPCRQSGRSLYLQYVGKKGKVVLDAHWVYKCVEAGQLQTYQNDFAGCKLTGTERYVM